MNVSIGVATLSLLLVSITPVVLKARINTKGEFTFLTGYMPAIGVINVVVDIQESKLLFIWFLTDQGASNDSYELFSLINLMLNLMHKLMLNLTLKLELASL